MMFRVQRRDALTKSVALPTLGRDGMLLVLTWAAGIMDAVAYLGLGVFTTMMTGNMALLAFAVARGERVAILRTGLALVAFGAGTAIGARIAGRGTPRGEWPSIITGALVCEGMLLGVFTIVSHLAGPAPVTAITGLLILLSALAMGIQSAAVRCLGVPGVATTYVTSTLTNLSAELVRGARPTDGNREQRIRLLASVFVTYGLGALVGAVLQSRSSTPVIGLPLISIAVVVVNAALRYRHGSSAAAARGGGRWWSA